MQGNAVLQDAISVTQYQDVKSVTRTELAQLLVSAGDRPFTVTFEKANNEERVLRGVLYNTEHLLGRSLVVDLDISIKENRLRLVDHRTLISMVYCGVFYKVRV